MVITFLLRQPADTSYISEEPSKPASRFVDKVEKITNDSSGLHGLTQNRNLIF